MLLNIILIVLIVIIVLLFSILRRNARWNLINLQFRNKLTRLRLNVKNKIIQFLRFHKLKNERKKDIYTKDLQNGNETALDHMVIIVFCVNEKTILYSKTI